MSTEKISQTEAPQLAAAPSNDGMMKDQKLKGVDALLGFVDETGGTALDEATNKKILRKIDLRILPWLWGLYFLQFLDKGVLSYAAVMGILTDANLTKDEFTWLGSIYYLGYMFALPIHNRLFQVFSPSRYTGVVMVLWGIVLCLMAACDNFTSLMVQRCILGSLESVVNCGLVLMTARWYNKSEHGVRVSLWSMSAGCAIITGSLIAFACLSATDSGLHSALPSWKIMAICLGVVSIIFALGLYFIMPPTLLEAKFFSEDEKRQAVERLRGNHSGLGSSEFKWHQAREAFLDVRIWLYVLFILLSQIPASGLQLMSSLIIQSLDFNSKQTLLLNVPTGTLQVLFQIATGFVADRTRQRALSALGIQVFALFGASLFVGLSNVDPLFERGGQLAAYYMMTSVSYIGYFILLAIISSNVVGTTKKTTANVILFITMAAAYLIGPQCFRDAPYYTTGRYITVAMWSASIIVLSIIWMLNRRENARRDKWMAEHGHTLPPNIEFMDLTDKENMKFRYIL